MKAEPVNNDAVSVRLRSSCWQTVEAEAVNNVRAVIKDGLIKFLIDLDNILIQMYIHKYINKMFVEENTTESYRAVCNFFF